MLVKNQGKLEKAFASPDYTFTQAAVSVSFALMGSLHPMSGATVPSFVYSAGCSGYGRELRRVVVCFKALAH